MNLSSSLSCVPAPILPGQERLPSPVNRRQQMRANPFMRPKAVAWSASPMKQPRLRSAVLTDEAARLYRCIAYTMQAYGVVMNGHMTIAWQEFRIRDHEQATKVLTEFNARMGKWLSVDGTGRKRKGVSLSTYGVGEKYFYTFIHEHALDHGFHTHQLIGVTDGKARAYAERAVRVLERLTGVTKAPTSAVVFTPGTVRDGFAPYLPRFRQNEVKRCWIWFRYLAKNLSPHEFKHIGDQCELQRNIFRIHRVFLPPQPVTCSDLFGCSQNIGIGAQTKDGFVSKFDSGDWTKLYSGSELDEYRQHVQQHERDTELAAIFDRVKI
ncbi:hypothetical protein [Bradyrhizobium canariense]|uniref:Uncharacterized protein n=1 Tax=Bradyrhizobium canariense TaxID=255045 RepID=A0A1H1YJL4_9BRAD|nr:hypothetical protein [Bradyrhizobium canariense]SDT21647.1 hypothetical protein SAMN05444158_4852 [Bradyrhizobium canariense]